MTWNPDQYARFREQRAQPFHDLLALVRPHPGMRVVDLGCGPGELTKIVHERLQARETLGIDLSDEMLAKSATYAGGGVHFERGDIGAFDGAGQYDLVISNAAVHWLPDQAAALRRLRDALAPGGQLAVQVPANFDHPSHTLAAEVAREEPFAGALGGHSRSKPILEPEEYSLLLYDLGFREQQVRLQVYLHLLPSRDDVIEWVKGTLLTDYQSRLSPELFESFLARYRELLLPALSSAKPYPYPFKRILMWASLAS